MMNYRNETLQTLFEKHNIRKYLDKQIDDETLGIIVDAGLRAPSSGGAQPTTFLVTTLKDMNLALGRLSCELYDEGSRSVSSAQPSIADDASLRDGFYGAPAVVHCFTPRGYSYAPFDASMAAANMMTAAWSLGVGAVSSAVQSACLRWSGRTISRGQTISQMTTRGRLTWCSAMRLMIAGRPSRSILAESTGAELWL